MNVLLTLHDTSRKSNECNSGKASVGVTKMMSMRLNLEESPRVATF
jgi:hypothetical protein